MIEGVFLSLVAACSMFAVRRWWYGVWLCIVIGFLQDPIRKIVPGEPVYMVVLCAFVFAGIVAGLLFRQYRFSIYQVPGWQRGVSTAMTCLLIVIVMQITLSYVNYGSAFLVGMAVLTYIAPILAILTGYYFACHVKEKGIIRFIAFYCIFSILFTGGIYLEYLGFEWGVLGEIGQGLLIFDVGTVLKGYAGFFRSSEIAAWHIMLGSCLLVIIATHSSSNSIRILCVVGVIFLIAAGILTGRRKLIVSVVIFITCYWLLISVYYRQSMRIAMIVVLVGATVFWASAREFYEADRSTDIYDLYVERASGVFSDISERGRLFGIGAVVSAVKKHGLFGLGAGTAGQGARFTNLRFGNIFEAEGGLGRIVTELGLIGLLALLWVVIMFVVYIFKLIRYVAQSHSNIGYICYGLIGILLANFAHFTVASQVFSDPTVLILLGLITGMIAAGPVLVRQQKLQQPTTI